MTLTLTVNDVLKSKIDIKLHYTTAHKRIHSMILLLDEVL